MPYRFYCCVAGARTEVASSCHLEEGICTWGKGKAFIITSIGYINCGTWILFI